MIIETQKWNHNLIKIILWVLFLSSAFFHLLFLNLVGRTKNPLQVMALRETLLEDGPFEILSALLLLLLGVYLLMGRTQLGPENIWSRRCIILLGPFLVLGAMEEINWGQHLFHFKTWPIFQEYNQQNELNFHNLTSPWVFDGLINLFFSTNFVVFPLWALLLPESKIGRYWVKVFGKLPPPGIIMIFICSFSAQVYHPWERWLLVMDICCSFFFFIGMSLMAIIIYRIGRSQGAPPLSLILKWILIFLLGLSFMFHWKVLGVKAYEMREFFLDIAMFLFAVDWFEGREGIEGQ